MPLITAKLIENVFTPKQKAEIFHRLTEIMVDIEGENLRNVTLVLIEEVKVGDGGIGGHILTATDVHGMQRGKAA